MKQGEWRVADRLVFSLLVIAEFFYRGIFLVWQLISRSCLIAKKLPSRVIAIGNLSVGGTGKTVFTHFLAQLLSHRNVAIIMRGYGGSISKTDKSVVINDGGCVVYSAEQTGDEAHMLAQHLTIPIVVGRNRFVSYKTLVNKTGTPGIVLLDDAYQNYQLQKDYQILLVDARRPLENNHCLPAGPLREKDYTRADIIILTHADQVTTETIAAIKKEFFPRFDPTKILAGKHVTTKISLANGQPSTVEELARHTFLCFAGIGSFSGFLATVKQNNLEIGYAQEFADHHPYTTTDLEELNLLAQQQQCSALITTEKDWVKIAPLLSSVPSFSLPIYVLSVGFEFLSPQEYSFFVDGLNRSI